MAIKGAEYAVTRIVATLQSYLPAELDLIETEMSDGVTLDDVADYYEHEAPASLVPSALCIVVNAESTEPIEIRSTTNTPGVYDADHRVVVRFELKDTYNEEPQVTKRRVLRYARAIERVLAIKYPTLPNGGVETVTRTYRIDPATYGREDQGEGQFVRTATIPFNVRNYETL